MVRTPTLYSGGPRFKSQTGDQIIVGFYDFSQSCQLNAEKLPQIKP
jgi:hypothetical protein